MICQVLEGKVAETHPRERRVTNEEYRFSRGVIISETDPHGIITYVNRRFCQISGYDRSELIGKNHNIIRHPEMPRAVFRELWSTIERGETWEGFIKNLRKDGRFYWVHTHIEPLYQDGKISGYVAIRRPADPDEIVEAELKYKAQLIQEKARI
jgi:aerotaxis receptor